MACSRDGDDLPSGDAVPVTFRGMLSPSMQLTRADATYESMTDTYGKIYVYHTRTGRFESGAYKDATDCMDFIPSGGVLMQQTNPDGHWYWDSPSQHLFHAWNLPTDGETQTEGGQALVTLGQDNRLGTVDLSMDGWYEEATGGRLSNLEYFVGAVNGPVNFTGNGGSQVLLSFEHLVAKITVTDIIHVKREGGSTTLEATDDVKFTMPNMPSKAYWTTGVPAEKPQDESTLKDLAVPPTLLPLKGKEGYDYQTENIEYGVEGTLHGGGCSFYIYPCDFENATRPGSSEKLAEITFEYGEYMFFGTLEGLGVGELKAGQHLSVKLLLKDGTVQGIDPYITDWNTGNNDAPWREKPGIYSLGDWKRYMDWVEECKTNPNVKNTPPEGLFGEDENGNPTLTFYEDLDLNGVDKKYKFPTDASGFVFPDGKDGKVDGKGHRVRVPEGTSCEDGNNVVDDLYLQTAPGKFSRV